MSPKPAREARYHCMLQAPQGTEATAVEEPDEAVSQGLEDCRSRREHAPTVAMMVMLKYKHWMYLDANESATRSI